MSEPTLEPQPSSASPDQPAGRSVVAFEFGPFRLDLPLRQLSREGQPIPLTPKAFDVFVALIRHRDRVFTKEELLATVWPKAFVTEDSLTQNIWALRRALGDDPAQPTYISTIPRLGYRFIADAIEIEGKEPAPALRSLETSRKATAEPETHGVAWARLRALRTSALVAVMVGVTAVVAFMAGRTSNASGVARSDVPVSFSQGAPDGSLLVPGVALSPDGRRLAFVAQNVTTRRSSIWIRDLASGQIHVVPGTEGGEQPFWSPKSNAIGFFSDGQLKTLDLAGGTPTVIASVGVLPQGGSWSEAGTIVFASWISGLFSVAAAGGPVTPITHIRREMAEFAHRRPQFLPGSKQYVYTIVTGKEATAGTYLGTIGSDERVRIFDTSVTAVQPASAHRIVGLRGGTLIQLALDEHGAVSPEGAQKIDGHIVPPGFQPQFGFSVSPAGLIAFGGGSDRERLMVYTREGKAERALNARSTRNPMLSPRGDQVVAIGRDSQAGIWLIDLERDVSTRITPAGNSPAWSPDGSAIAFGSNQEQGIRDLYLRSISGRPEDKLLLHTDESKTINDWSRDGKYIVYASTNEQRKQDLWLLPMFGERTPIPYLRSGSSQIQAQVSPDGRWMAYTSDESGQWEVYLQSFPTPGMKRTISIGGGGEPRWSADGHELFYMRADKSLMSVSIPGGDPTHGVGSPKVLFTVPVVGDTSTYRSRYTVNARGDRFLFNALDESSQTPITVLVNWESVTAN